MSKRRSNGEGTLRKRKDNRWEMSIMDGYDNNGKRKIITFYGKTQKEVKEKASQYKRDLDDGLKLDQTLMFDKWADTWFESHCGIEATTRESYRYTLKKLKDRFGSYRLIDI